MWQIRRIRESWVHLCGLSCHFARAVMTVPAEGLECAGTLTIMVAGVPGCVALRFTHFTTTTLFAPGLPGARDFFSTAATSTSAAWEALGGCGAAPESYVEVASFCKAPREAKAGHWSQCAGQATA